MISFRPELAEAVMAGRKTVTRRLVNTDNPRSHWHRNQVAKLTGKSVAVCPGRGKHQIGRVTVTAVERDLFYPASITDIEARREGFDSAEAFVATWKKLHKGSVLPVYVWRVELAEPVRAERGGASDG